MGKHYKGKLGIPCHDLKYPCPIEGCAYAISGAVHSQSGGFESAEEAFKHLKAKHAVHCKQYCGLSEADLQSVLQASKAKSNEQSRARNAALRKRRKVSALREGSSSILHGICIEIASLLGVTTGTDAIRARTVLVYSVYCDEVQARYRWRYSSPVEKEE